MSSDDLVNYAFAYVLIGAVIWMLMFSAGLITETLQKRIAAGDAAPHFALVLASVAVVVAWPLMVIVFVHGMWTGALRVWGARR
jgi:hypothetical protein